VHAAVDGPHATADSLRDQVGSTTDTVKDHLPIG
jgi:hypothetical protein